MKVGICGLGTVGSGLFNLFAGPGMARLQGVKPVLTHVGCRRDHPACDLSSVKVSRDIFAVARDPEVSVVAELIGGTEVARELALEAINAGKHLVTANKALIALHGGEIFAAAEKAGVQVRFEAAIAGGIPIVKALREGLAANRINWVAGIINGTCNFILSEMAEMAKEGSNQSFDEVLLEAQRLGYAEADPSFDVEGIDAAHKLTILAAIAFDIPLQFDAMFTEGISAITPDDISFATELGYRIRHLGIARHSDSGVELRVHPALIPAEHMLAQVSGVMNAVMIDADAAGPTLYYGAGAGSLPTASAVMADIIDVARGASLPNPGGTRSNKPSPPIVPISEVVASSYLKLKVEDQPGVMASIAAILSAEGVSIEAMIQKDARQGGAQIVMITNEVAEAAIKRCIEALTAATDRVHSVSHIRVAPFDAPDAAVQQARA